MEKSVVRETILVISNGNMEMFEEMLKECGCNLIRTNASDATKVVQEFIKEFRQGIPLAIIHGYYPDQASILAMRLKHVCNGMRVIALSGRIGQPIQEADRAYDLIIPHSCSDLRGAMDMFLRYND